MKKQLSKRLYAFIVPIAIGMMFSTSANAQIVYTDVNPDLTVTNVNSYYLDLNNDGTSDYKIITGGGMHWPFSSSYWVSDSVLHGNAVAGSTYPRAMNLGDTISSGIGWSGSGTLYSISTVNSIPPTSSHYGNWTPGTEHYLGLKLIVGNNTYYGWVRMQVGNVSRVSLSCIIKDYAYNSIPDSAILAGQTMTITGITENSFASSINLFPNPANNHLTIALGSNNKIVQVTIADITGKVIYTTIATDTQKVEVNTKDFAEGIYVVQIQAAGFIGTKKLVVEK